MRTILLFIASNIFMTIAWYWHLKGGMQKPILLVILISWAIALVEYCFAVPANRLGYAGGWTAGQLKITRKRSPSWSSVDSWSPFWASRCIGAISPLSAA